MPTTSPSEVTRVAKARRDARGRRAAVAALMAAGATLGASREVRADVTSWFAVSGGVTSLAQAQMERATAASLHFDLGVGTSPARAVIVGGLLKSLTSFGQGTDFALLARVATGGFVRGGWGLAADVGPYRRWWGGRSTGVFGELVVGAPYGLQVSAFTEQGTEQARAYGAAIGIDLLRLTVFRTSTQSTWHNPILPMGVEPRQR